MVEFPVPQIRDYRPADEPEWLRCRVLSFLDTCYYDDVATAKPVEDDADRTIELVAVRGDAIAGLMDVAVRGELATIECVAVHPDHQRAGVAGALLSTALKRLAATPTPMSAPTPGPVPPTVLDAWTREDRSALAWYAACGFVETETYLHVYSGYNRAATLVAPNLPLRPVSVFAHAAREHEARMRAEFDRVYVCRRMQRQLT
jgi:ribosomal protein S18 acetylase RimI-like enzyme